MLAVPQGLVGALALRDVVNDGIEKPPALQEDRTAVDLDVADRAVGKAVPEKENALFFLHGPLHFQVHGPGVEHVDVADPERFQLPGGVTIESDGCPVGIHDPATIRIYDQHDGVVVAEKARVELHSLPWKHIRRLAIRRAALRGLRAVPAAPQLFCRRRGLFVPGGRLHRTLCRHKKPLTTGSGGPLSTPAGSKAPPLGNSCNTSARQII